MSKILEVFVMPTLTRLGTMIGASAITYGATVQQAQAIELGVVAGVAFLIDLITSNQRIKHKTKGIKK
jgi:hypothetical protein